MIDLMWQTRMSQIRCIVFRKIKNRADAEDILQETMSAAVARGYRGTESHLFFFLKRVLRNKLADYFRKLKANQEVSLEIEDVAGPAWLHKADLSREFEMKEAIQKLEAILDRLSKDDQMLITLLIEGCSPRIICQRLGTNMDALRIRRWRLKSKIEALMQRKGPKKARSSP